MLFSCSRVLLLACAIAGAHAVHMTFDPSDDVKQYLSTGGARLTSVHVQTDSHLDDVVSFLVSSQASRPALKAIKASGPRITRLPVQISLVESLESLDVSNSGIRELPYEIGRLKSLRLLDVSNTGITKLPPVFAGMTSLSTLVVSPNRITELAYDIGRPTPYLAREDVRNHPIFKRRLAARTTGKSAAPGAWQVAHSYPKCAPRLIREGPSRIVVVARPTSNDNALPLSGDAERIPSAEPIVSSMHAGSGLGRTATIALCTERRLLVNSIDIRQSTLASFKTLPRFMGAVHASIRKSIDDSRSQLAEFEQVMADMGVTPADCAAM
ncbi:Leucine-rich repeat domain-containing protein [Plasmodiophora brassicae]